MEKDQQLYIRKVCDICRGTGFVRSWGEEPCYKCRGDGFIVVEYEKNKKNNKKVFKKNKSSTSN